MTYYKSLCTSACRYRTVSVSEMGGLATSHITFTV